MQLRASDITVTYGRHRAVDGVSLAAAPGEMVAILGANGSGKSSLLRALAGVQRHGGRVSWGMPGRIGYMPQDSAGTIALTAFEVVLLGRLRSLALRVGGTDLVAARAALEELGIGDLAPRPIGALSGGQRQLVFLAQALAGTPGALLLDEPTSALDIAHQLHVLDVVRAMTRRRAMTCIAVLHDLNAAARFADRVVLLRAGRLIADGPPAAVLNEAAIRQAYGVRAEIILRASGPPVIVPLCAEEAARV